MPNKLTSKLASRPHWSVMKDSAGRMTAIRNTHPFLITDSGPLWFTDYWELMDAVDIFDFERDKERKVA